MKQAELLKELKELKPAIKRNTYRTIKGQILAGDYAGAERGIERMKNNGLLLHKAPADRV